MRKTLLLVGLVAMLSGLHLLGCGTNNGPVGPGPAAEACGDGTFEFVVHLTGYDDDIGQLFELRAFKAELDENREFYILIREVDSVRVAAIPSADFSVRVCLEDGVLYVLELYADHDGDGRFTATPADHTHRLGFVPYHADLTETTAAHLVDRCPHLEWP